MLLPGKVQKPDKREYTFMLVPHHGQAGVHSIRVPLKTLKYSVAAVCVCVLLLVGAVINYRHTVDTASAERVELEQLRQTNGFHVKQIEQLAKATAVLQSDMDRLNKLDTEIRRIVNSDDLTGTSRSGQSRPDTSYTGQGGPIVKPEIGDISNLVQELQVAAQAREQSLSSLKQALVEKNAKLAATPSIWPASGDVTSRFGWRNSPWGGSSGDWHPGIDIANSYGTPIMATADGQVVKSEWYGGYGNMVQIDHGNGIVTIYGHTSRIVVSVGQRVKKGEVIAYMGSTGNSTGTHVHYEIRVNDTAVNPANFL
jgi:murein DD-endopeptidase MepM/ murein hydrolase activator NlpD